MFLCINWEAVAACASFLTCCIAGFTAYKGLEHYRKDIKFTHEATRNQMLAEYNQRYSQNISIQKVVKALMSNEFNDVEAYDAEIFMRFFEELQLLIKSDNKMKKEIACYMFSYYAIEAYKSNKFKDILNGENKGEQNKQPDNQEIGSNDWKLFRDFVSDMEETRESLYTNNEINNLSI